MDKKTHRIHKNLNPMKINIHTVFEVGWPFINNSNIVILLQIINDSPIELVQ